MTEQSEGDLLEELLAALDDPNMQFKLGKLMGIMSKGHLNYIASLKDDLELMKVDRDHWRRDYFQVKKERNEQEGQS